MKHITFHIYIIILGQDSTNILQKINPKYKENLTRLKNLVLVKFDGDHMVVPKESEVRTRSFIIMTFPLYGIQLTVSFVSLTLSLQWFGYYAPNDVSTILAFNETQLYKEVGGD